MAFGTDEVGHLQFRRAGGRCRSRRGRKARRRRGHSSTGWRACRRLPRPAPGRCRHPRRGFRRAASAMPPAALMRASAAGRRPLVPAAIGGADAGAVQLEAQPDRICALGVRIAREEACRCDGTDAGKHGAAGGRQGQSFGHVRLLSVGTQVFSPASLVSFGVCANKKSLQINQLRAQPVATGRRKCKAP